MRILFMTQVLPWPLDGGPKVRAHYVIRYLVEAGHEVHLLSFARRGEAVDAVPVLRRMCASVQTVPIVRSRARDLRDGLKSLWTGTPFLVVRDQLPAMALAVRRLAGSRSIDALHGDQLWMAPYVAQALAGQPLRVLDQHNAVFLVPRRLAEHRWNPLVRGLLRLEAARLRRFERDACGRADRVVWVSEADRDALRSPGESAHRRDLVIPIATDPSAQPRIRRSAPHRVTFLGGLHWPPNRDGVEWFLGHVWPRIAEVVPSAVFTVIGRDGAAAVRGAPARPRIDVTGYVRDLQPYLAETAVFVVPLRSGAGVRVKILDAWCWGLPIVSTAMGAEGLRAVHGENVLIADAPDAFADAVIHLLEGVGTASRLADGGRATVEQHYDWRVLYTAWDRVYSAARVAARA